MKREYKIAVKFAVLMLISYVSYAFVFAMIIPYLNSIGISAQDRGIIFTFGAILTILGQVLFGYLCDKFQSNKKMFYLASLILSAVTYMFYITSSDVFFLILLWGGMISAFFRITMGVMDSWIIESDDFCLTNFGAVRAFGAIGWAIGSPLTAIVVQKSGYGSLGLIFFGLTAVTLGFGLLIADSLKVTTETKIRLTDVKVFFHNQRYMLLVIVFFFINVIANADMYITIDKIIALGGGNDMIGYKWSFQALCELPLFFLGGVVIKKFGAKKLVFFATLMYIVRYVLLAMAISPLQVVYASALQMLTFPLIMVASKVMIDEVSPKHLRASGQQFAGSIYSGVSLLVTPLLCGIIVQQFSFNFALIAMAVLCIVPLWLISLYHSQQPTGE
jgi:MFS family permease